MRCSAKSISSLPMTGMLLTAASVVPVVASPDARSEVPCKQLKSQRSVPDDLC